ncbi:MAG TPA: LacI family DNA-binding transcriptional regulator [Haloplasmataceae bacterium]
MANIKDVAKRANVSVATVSRVINNKGYVNEETRQLVLKAIEELNYIPNEFARSLFKKTSHTIGVILPHLNNSFYYEVLEGIEEFAFQNGYKVMICNTHEDPEREEVYLKQFVRYNFDGLITGSNSNLIDKYLELDIPLVSIDRFIADQIPSVFSDNVNGGYLAAQKLVRTGSRRIVHFRGPSILHTVQQRAQGFNEGLKEAGLTCDEVDLAFIDPEVHRIRDYLRSHPDIDGVFCDSDLIASAVIAELLDMGKRIPEDVQVIGYDDQEIARYIYPKLTTISQNMFDIGEAAITLLHRLMKGEDVEQYHLVIPVTLVERETTRKEE